MGQKDENEDRAEWEWLKRKVEFHDEDDKKKKSAKWIIMKYYCQLVLAAPQWWLHYWLRFTNDHIY